MFVLFFCLYSNRTTTITAGYCNCFLSFAAAAMLLSDGLRIFLSFMFCTAAPHETLPYTSFIAAGLHAEPASTPSLGLVTRRWAAGPDRVQ